MGPERHGDGISVDGTLGDFIGSHYGRLVVAMELACGNRALAEDAVQEALARALEHTRRGGQIDSLPGWVMVVARNLARSWYRRLLAEARATQRSAQPPPASDDAAHSERLVVLDAVRRLSPRQRQAVALYYFADLPVEGVAQVMGLRPQAVKSLLHRGRAALAQALGSRALLGGEEATGR